MKKHDRTIEIKIATKKDKGKGRVSFNLLSNIFSSMQNIFNELGDYFAGEKFRESGPSKSSIADFLELELIGAHHSDLTIVAELPTHQMTLSTDKPLSAIVLNNFDRIIDTIESHDDIGQEVGKIIKDEKHKIKILKSVSDFWPEKEYDISLRVGNNPHKVLNYQRKVVLSKYLGGEKKEGDEELIGPLVSLTVVEPLIFYIGKKPRVKCEFSSDIEDMAKKYIGKIVKIIGRPAILQKGGEKIFENVSHIKPINEWEFRGVCSEEYDLKFKETLMAKVDFIDKMVVIENEEYNILCISDSWEECIEQFNEFFVFLWKEFALVSDDELTKDALVLKHKLKNLVV